MSSAKDRNNRRYRRPHKKRKIYFDVVCNDEISLLRSEVDRVGIKISAEPIGVSEVSLSQSELDLIGKVISVKPKNVSHASLSISPLIYKGRTSHIGYLKKVPMSRSRQNPKIPVLAFIVAPPNPPPKPPKNK